MAYGSKQQIMDTGEAQGRDTNAIMADWVDRGPWLYWDTINFEGGSPVQQQYSVFSVPIGAQNPLTVASSTKSKLQTNMQRGNQFPPPRCLLLASIGFYFSSDFTKEDIDKIVRTSYFEFRIDDKIFHEGFMWMFPPGAGLTGTTTSTDQQTWTLGQPSPEKMRRFGDWAKYIAPLQQFSLTITFGGGGIPVPTLSGTADTDLTPNLIVFMDGLTDRSVQ